MPYNAGIQPIYLPRVGQLATPLETRWAEAQARAFREMPRQDYAAAGIGTMMQSEANLDAIGDAIESAKAQRAAADKPSPSVDAALDRFIEERRILVGVCERLNVARKPARAFENSWDCLLMGLDRTALEPVPVIDQGVDIVGRLGRQTLQVVEAETQKLKDLRAVLQNRLEHLDGILTYAARPVADQCKEILRVLVTRIDDIERHLKRKASTNRKLK